MLYVCYSELESRIGKDESLYKQLDIYEILVNLYPKKMYFIQLGGSTHSLVGRLIIWLH